MAESRIASVVPPGSGPALAHAPPPLPQPGGEAADPLRNLLGVLRRNLLLIALIALTTVGTAAYFLSRQVPVYRARGLIRLVDTRQSMTGSLGEIIPAGGRGGGRADPILSQLEVLKGRLVMGEVVDRLGLRVMVQPGTAAGEVLDVVEVRAPERVSRGFQLRFQPGGYTAEVDGATLRGTYGQPLEHAGIRLTLRAHPGVDEAVVSVIPRESAIDYLIGTLAARPKQGTDAVEIEHTANDPRFAQRVVNTALQEFQEFSAGTEQQQASRRRVFLEEQLRSADSVFNETQAALTAFRSREQVFDSRETFAGQQEALAGLRARREEMAADRAIYRSLLADIARRDGGRREQALRTVLASGVGADPAVAQLAAQLAQYEAARDSMTTSGATEAHPDAQRLNGQIAATENRLIDAVRSHVAALDARIAALDGMQARDASDIQRLPATEAQEVRLLQRVESIRRLSDQLREELQRARITEAVEAGQVQIVYPAPLPSAPAGASRSVRLGIALVFGLLLGAGAAVLRDRMNTLINSRSELEKQLKIPGLAIIPPFGPVHARGGALGPLLSRANGNGTGGGAKPGGELVVVSQLQSAGAEAYRTLRTNLMFSQAARSLKRVVVTSAAPGDGKSTTAANVAASFAQQGLRVLLVDCDLRKARLHYVFGVPREPGLTQVLLRYVPADEAINPTGVEGLSLMTSGPLPPNPSELLGGGAMEETLAYLSERFDLLVIDTPPMMAAADGAILARAADGVILVVRAGRTDRNAAWDALNQITSVGGRILGAVLNDPEGKAPRYGGQYYAAYYGDGS